MQKIFYLNTSTGKILLYKNAVIRMLNNEGFSASDQNEELNYIINLIKENSSLVITAENICTYKMFTDSDGDYPALITFDGYYETSDIQYLSSIYTLSRNLLYCVLYALHTDMTTLPEIYSHLSENISSLQLFLKNLLLTKSFEFVEAKIDGEIKYLSLESSTVDPINTDFNISNISYIADIYNDKALIKSENTGYKILNIFNIGAALSTCLPESDKNTLLNSKVSVGYKEMKDSVVIKNPNIKNPNEYSNYATLNEGFFISKSKNVSFANILDEIRSVPLVRVLSSSNKKPVSESVHESFTKVFDSHKIYNTLYSPQHINDAIKPISSILLNGNKSKSKIKSSVTGGIDNITVNTIDTLEKKYITNNTYESLTSISSVKNDIEKSKIDITSAPVINNTIQTGHIFVSTPNTDFAVMKTEQAIANDHLVADSSVININSALYDKYATNYKNYIVNPTINQLLEMLQTTTSETLKYYFNPNYYCGVNISRYLGQLLALYPLVYDYDDLLKAYSVISYNSDIRTFLTSGASSNTSDALQIMKNETTRFLGLAENICNDSTGNLATQYYNLSNEDRDDYCYYSTRMLISSRIRDLVYQYDFSNVVKNNSAFKKYCKLSTEFTYINHADFIDFIMSSNTPNISNAPIRRSTTSDRKDLSVITVTTNYDYISQLFNDIYNNLSKCVDDYIGNIPSSNTKDYFKTHKELIWFFSNAKGLLIDYDDDNYIPYSVQLTNICEEVYGSFFSIIDYFNDTTSNFNGLKNTLDEYIYSFETVYLRNKDKIIQTQAEYSSIVFLMVLIDFFKTHISYFTDEEKNTIKSIFSSANINKIMRLIRYCCLYFGSFETAAVPMLYNYWDTDAPRFTYSKTNSDIVNQKILNHVMQFLLSTGVNKENLHFNLYNRETVTMDPGWPNAVVSIVMRPQFYTINSNSSSGSILYKSLDQYAKVKSFAKIVGEISSYTQWENFSLLKVYSYLNPYTTSNNKTKPIQKIETIKAEAVFTSKKEVLNNAGKITQRAPNIGSIIAPVSGITTIRASNISL